MNTFFKYSNEFEAMNSPELSRTCMHLLCTGSEGSFVFNGHCYHIVKNDLVVMPYPHRAQILAEPAAVQQLQHRRQHKP